MIMKSAMTRERAKVAIIFVWLYRYGLPAIPFYSCGRSIYFQLNSLNWTEMTFVFCLQFGMGNNTIGGNQ